MNEILLNMPKVELHLHLDGSLRVNTVHELLNKKISIEEIESKLIAPKKCKDLNEYLTYFNLPDDVLQTKESLIRVTKELIEDLEKENVIYAEIRFAPMSHTKKGLTQEEVVLAVLEGIKNLKIMVNLILCCRRGFSYEDNIETINVANKYYNKGVCAIDLVGSEIDYPDNDYYLFDIAKEKGLEFTIHAGETNGPDIIKKAIDKESNRIGHGINAIKDINLVKELVDKKIVLEICPTSNIQSDAVDIIENHPIYELYKKGVLVTINTDNRTVSNTTLTKEYELLLNTFNLAIEDIKKMNLNAIRRAFISEEDKIKLYNIINKGTN